MAPGMASQRSEDFLRNRGGHYPGVPFGTPTSRGSVDSTPHSTYRDPSFATSMSDYVPMDMSSRATPESTSTRASSQQHHPFASQTLNAHVVHNPVHKLDTLMFPSEDPFAYPNQPMMGLGFQPKSESTSITMVSPSQEAAFFFPSSLDEMGDHMMGQPPPYMMPHQHQQPGPGAMGMAASMYDPNGMMGMHPAHAQHQRRVVQPLAQPNRRARADRQQERQIEQMFTEHGMQPDWGSFFGGGRGGFQGM